MKKILITGATGYLGSCLAKHLSSLFEVVATHFTKQPFSLPSIWWEKLDVTDKNNVERVFERTLPDIVIHCSAIASIGECEASHSIAVKMSLAGTNDIVRASNRFNAYLIFLSTDMVFDGESAPYDESSKPAPLSVYGKTKLEAEKVCLPSALVLRLSLCYGYTGSGGRSFLESAIEKIKHGEKAVFFHDEWRTPLWVWDLAKAVERIARARPMGLIHLGGNERMSRLEMAQRACKKLGADLSLIVPASRLGSEGTPRPKDLSLDISKFRQLFPDFSFTPFEEAVSEGLIR
jgi:dTDP-4-dehydrorhamnose reductase